MPWKASTIHDHLQVGTQLHIYFVPQVRGGPKQSLPGGVDLDVSYHSGQREVIYTQLVRGDEAVVVDADKTEWLMSRATDEDPRDPIETSGLHSEYWIVRIRNPREHIPKPKLPPQGRPAQDFPGKSLPDEPEYPTP